MLANIPSEPSVRDFLSFIKALMLEVENGLSISKAYFYLACIKTVYSMETDRKLMGDVEKLEELVSVRYSKSYQRRRLVEDGEPKKANV